MLVLQKGLILPVPMYGGSYFFIQPQLFFIAFKRYQQYFSDIIISFLNKGTTALLCSKPQSSQNMGIGC